MLRAAEINADVIMLAKNVDGVYDSDPVQNPDAKKYDQISYDDILAQHLSVMDSTATSLSMDNKIPYCSLRWRIRRILSAPFAEKMWEQS